MIYLLKTKINIWFAIFVFVILKYNTLAYNLDVNNVKIFNIPKTFNNQRGSYFGFSVALYTEGLDSILLVGAPRANSSTIKNVIEPGTVYQCSINKTCKEWIIDKSGNSEYSEWNQIKDNAWIGATIAVENKTNPRIVVCGPRWKKKDKYNWYMNGICYLLLVNNIKFFENEVENKILSLSNYSNFTYPNNRKVYNFEMSQIGFSINMVSIGLKWYLILGSPGIFNWKGLPLLVKKPIYGKIQFIIPSTKNEKRIRENSYFGYAVTSGYFIKGELWFVSGAPKDSNMNGSVIIFTFPETNNAIINIKKFLRGEQYGEYFGAALTSCNLNGDAEDELIVGAPLWSKNIDEGRIYVYTALSNENFKKQSFDGKISESRFGSTISCLGDIDYDGYNDIAVGAPYEEGTGAIYIFNGNSNGLLRHYSQKIIGKQFGKNIRGFGISISEPRDINGDKYPDIAVGAYLSEQVVLIKSKPIVTVITQLIYEDKKLLINSSSFLINICTYYDGINAPKFLRVVKFLKIDEIYGRAYYNTEKNNINIYKFSETLYKSKNLCKKIEIHLKENIQNIINPIEISVKINLEKNLSNNERNLNFFCTSCAIINKLLSKTEDLIKLPFAVDCGEDNICTSDVKILLSTDLKSGNRYIIGSVFTTKFKLDVFNNGEPAYQAKIYIYIPKILSLASIPSLCIENFYKNNTLEVICDLGNPLKKNKKLILNLDMSKVQFDIDHVQLWTNFTITGKAQHDLYSYFFENEDKKLNSIQFQHIYEIQKFGASPINQVILTISIPTFWKQSIGDIQIININDTTCSYIDNQPFHCTYLNSTVSTALIDNFKIYTANTEKYTEKFITDSNFSINFPPKNRSLYVDCINDNIKCTYIKYKLGPFLNSLSIAKISLILDFYLPNFKSMMAGKDIIFFLSRGNVNILESHHIIQKIGHKPDNVIVATMFLGSLITEQIATWIIILSIFLGNLLLILLILILLKIGFFKRKKKREFEILKFENKKT
ncbi:Integrin alpha-PS3 [Apis cerana cerana]|uniref:Integrin alpha-PS3 n=1 Tax=Apis cerana cerana TaxID=94128 RepID=A0A2A3E419_APICC|nr:Integrin alpha-PS3 [Apis cerana cerana]